MATITGEYALKNKASISIDQDERTAFMRSLARNTPRALALLVQVWPKVEELVKWPTHGLTDADAYNFSVAQISHLDHLFRSRAGNRFFEP